MESGAGIYLDVQAAIDTEGEVVMGTEGEAKIEMEVGLELTQRMRNGRT